MTTTENKDFFYNAESGWFNFATPELEFCFNLESGGFIVCYNYAVKLTDYTSLDGLTQLGRLFMDSYISCKTMFERCGFNYPTFEYIVSCLNKFGCPNTLRFNSKSGLLI